MNKGMPLLLSKLLPEFTDLHAHENKVSTYFVISDIFIDTFTESISIIKNIGSGYYYTLIAFSPYEKWPEKDDQAPIYHQSHSLLTNNGGGMFF